MSSSARCTVSPGPSGTAAAAASASSAWIRSASSSTPPARRLHKMSGRTTTATARPCRVMVTSSPSATRSRTSGKAALASLTVIVAITKLYNTVHQRTTTRRRPGSGSAPDQPPQGQLGVQGGALGQRGVVEHRVRRVVGRGGQRVAARRAGPQHDERPGHLLQDKREVLGPGKRELGLLAALGPDTVGNRPPRE